MCPLTTQLWCMELLLLNTLTIRIPTRATCQVLLWHGARGSRWVPQLGAVGAATGAIAIGAAATLTSTIIIISIATTISTATTSTEARDKVIGNTTRNTAAMLLMVTGGLPISLAETNAARVEEERVLAIAPVAAPELAIVQVEVLELVIAQVEVLEPEIVRAAGPAIGLVVAELELGQVAVAPRTKSVTAAHHRDPAGVLAEGDLAVVVETTRVLAATEAVIAWAAAV